MKKSSTRSLLRGEHTRRESNFSRILKRASYRQPCLIVQPIVSFFPTHIRTSHRLFGVSPAVKKGALNVIEVVKNAIIERGGRNGIRTMGILLRQLDSNGNGALTALELHEGLATWDIDLTEQDMKKIMQYFDKDGNGSVTIDEFMRGL